MVIYSVGIIFNEDQDHISPLTFYRHREAAERHAEHINASPEIKGPLDIHRAVVTPVHVREEE